MDNFDNPVYSMGVENETTSNTSQPRVLYSTQALDSVTEGATGMSTGEVKIKLPDMENPYDTPRRLEQNRSATRNDNNVSAYAVPRSYKGEIELPPPYEEVPSQPPAYHGVGIENPLYGRDQAHANGISDQEAEIHNPLYDNIGAESIRNTDEPIYEDMTRGGKPEDRNTPTFQINAELNDYSEI